MGQSSNRVCIIPSSMYYIGRVKQTVSSMYSYMRSMCNTSTEDEMSAFDFQKMFVLSCDKYSLTDVRFREYGLSKLEVYNHLLWYRGVVDFKSSVLLILGMVHFMIKDIRVYKSMLYNEFNVDCNYGYVDEIRFASMCDRFARNKCVA